MRGIKMTQPPVRSGDFVQCLFPFNEKPEQPGPMPHIAYCLGVEQTPMGKLAIVAVYTTTTMRPEKQPKSKYTVEIDEASSRRMGMEKPFTIQPTHTAYLPLTPEFFPKLGQKDFVIGSASEGLRKTIRDRFVAGIGDLAVRVLGPKNIRPQYLRPFS